MNELRAVTAPVFNIQSYCIHDGPGIRSTVFVKGCPLRCLWCHNPESNSARPELMEYGSKCTACGACLAVCPKGAVSLRESAVFQKPVAVADRHKCVTCGACVSVCPNEAREISGRLRSAGEVFDEVARDKMFYDASGGGVTLSGGEVLLYPDFAEALFSLCHAEGIHTAIESCLFASRETLDRVMAHTDLVLCDLKHMDGEEHKRLTGVDNAVILSNVRHLRQELHKPMIVRTPVIPGMNADESNIEATARFIARELGPDTPYQLLPYNDLGVSKRISLGLDAGEDTAVPPDELMQQLKAVAERHLASVQIGGD